MATQKQHNRKIRQEALRDQLSNGKHVQHVIEITTKIADPNEIIEREMLDRYKVVIDTKMKLINKYLPDLRSQEITGDGGEPLIIPTLTSKEAEQLSKALDDKY